MKTPCLARVSAWIAALFSVSIVAACGGGTPIPATLPPSLTPTPKSTPLPTVGTSVPLGSSERPYQVVVRPPEGSTATGTSLASFLNDRTGLAFKVQIASSADPSSPNPLTELCGGTPTFAWVDGWTLLAAQAEGCAQPMLKIKRNSDSGSSTGVRADLVVRTVNKTTSIAGLKDRIFCRLNSQDVVSWILPVMMMRGAGLSPQNLNGVRDFPDYATMLQALADGVCAAAAIPAGTLTDYKVTDKSGQADITKLINQLATSPEVPYGGLVVSSTVPQEIAATVTKLFVEHPDELKDLVQADELVITTAADFAEVEKFIDASGVAFKMLGQ